MRDVERAVITDLFDSLSRGGGGEGDGGAIAGSVRRSRCRMSNHSFSDAVLI